LIEEEEIYMKKVRVNVTQREELRKKENKDSRVQGGKYEWRRENLEMQGQTRVLSESVVIKRSAGKWKGMGVDYYRREYQEEI
jgi:hypothetical protein